MKLPRDLSRQEVTEKIYKILNHDGILDTYPAYAEKIFDEVFGDDCDRVIATSPDSHVLWQNQLKD